MIYKRGKRWRVIVYAGRDPITGRKCQERQRRHPSTGRPWLDHFACPNPGPVLVFLGEGGERATMRRIEAIATAKGIDPDQLGDRLRLCFRVPLSYAVEVLRTIRTWSRLRPPCPSPASGF